MRHPVKISKMIYGLGNPGSKYSKNRHNVGKLFVDYIAKHYNAQYRSSLTAGNYIIFKNSKDKYVAFYQSPSFMNLSGLSFKVALKQCNLNVNDVLIAHDDLDTKLGKTKIKVGGSPEGHNGLKSIISTVGTQKFDRLKLGVSRPVSHDPAIVASYVLQDFKQDEHQVLSTQTFPNAIKLLQQKEYL